MVFSISIKNIISRALCMSMICVHILGYHHLNLPSRRKISCDSLNILRQSRLQENEKQFEESADSKEFRDLSIEDLVKLAKQQQIEKLQKNKNLKESKELSSQKRMADKAYEEYWRRQKVANKIDPKSQVRAYYSLQRNETLASKFSNQVFDSKLKASESIPEINSNEISYLLVVLIAAAAALLAKTSLQSLSEYAKHLTAPLGY